MGSCDGVFGPGLSMLSSSATKRYNFLVDLENSPHQPFTQESLVAYMDDIQSMRKTSRAMDGKEWDLKRLMRLMTILKGGYCCFDSFETIFVYRSNFSCSDLFIFAYLQDKYRWPSPRSSQNLPPLARPFLIFHF